MLEAWSHPTWLFFHSLAEKINEDFLKKNTLDVLNMIKNICVNLPCPILKKYKFGRFDIIYVHFITSFTKKFNSTLLAGRFSRNSKRKQLGINLNTWFKKYWGFFN